MISVCMICLEMYSSGFGTGSEIIRPKINQIPPVLRLDPSVFIGGDVGMVVPGVLRVSYRGSSSPTRRTNLLGFA